jgi:hypothetical protein
LFYAAFSQETSSFLKEYIFASLRDIEAYDTLEGIFLDDGSIISFPEQERVLRLGGHGPRTQYLHIHLFKIDRGWSLEPMHACR